MDENKERTLNCDVCGKPFTAKAYNARYCSECRDKVRREQKRELRHMYKSMKKESNRKKPSLSVAEIQAIGRKRHMSYGETVVWLKYHHPNGRRKNPCQPKELVGKEKGGAK